MSLPTTIISVLIYLAVPAGVLLLGRRIKLVQKVNPVIICYILGILVGNIGVLPQGFELIGRNYCWNNWLRRG